MVLKLVFDDALGNVDHIWKFIAVAVACEKLGLLQGPKIPCQIELRQRNKKKMKKLKNVATLIFAIAIFGHMLRH